MRVGDAVEHEQQQVAPARLDVVLERRLVPGLGRPATQHDALMAAAVRRTVQLGARDGLERDAVFGTGRAHGFEPRVTAVPLNEAPEHARRRLLERRLDRVQPVDDDALAHRRRPLLPLPPLPPPFGPPLPLPPLPGRSVCGAAAVTPTSSRSILRSAGVSSVMRTRTRSPSWGRRPARWPVRLCRTGSK